MSIVQSEYQPSGDRKVDVQLNALDPADAEREQRPLMLQVAELPRDCSPPGGHHLTAGVADRWVAPLTGAMISS